MNEAIVVDTSPSYLRVCLCPCEHSHCYNNSIPLKKLYKTLVEYFNVHGATGNLMIDMYYKDEKGVIKPLDPTITSK